METWDAGNFGIRTETKEHIIGENGQDSETMLDKDIEGS
jgi:hypothetical protein